MTESTEILPSSIIALDSRYLFRWEEAQQAHVLLYPEGLVKLNDTAAAILELCDGKTSAQDLATQLAAKFDGDDIETGVFKFLEVAHAKGWIRINP